MVDTNEPTTEIELKVRRCNNCQHEAVSLDGPGADCMDCYRGEYTYYNGRSQTVELPESQVEDISPREIID